MRRTKMKVHIILLLIIAFVLGGMSHINQSVKVCYCAEQEPEITSSVRIYQSDVKPLLRQEQIGKENGSGEWFQRLNRRNTQIFVRRTEVATSSVDIRSQFFYSRLYWQDNPITDGTSGHISMIQCVHRKDGKKDNLL